MKKTIYTFRKTGAKYTLTKIDEETNRAVITDEFGDHHLVSINTLKKNYKKEVIEEEEPNPEMMPMPGTEDPDWGDKAAGLNEHQKLAKKQIKAAYNWVMGGYENDVADGNRDKMPPVGDLFEEVYDTALNEGVGVGSIGGKNKPELRFAGKEFCYKVLVKLFKADGYEVPESCYKTEKKAKTEKEPKKGSRKNIKGDDQEIKEGQVLVKAFTGMVIGVFDITKQTGKTITIKTAKGELKFDRNTGIQINANNPKFANRIDAQG